MSSLGHSLQAGDNASKSPAASPRLSPRPSPRIASRHSYIGNVLHGKFHRNHKRETPEASPDIPAGHGADSTYGGSLADLDIGASALDGRPNSRGLKSGGSVSNLAMTSFYDQVKGWYEKEVERIGQTSNPATAEELDSLKQLETILSSVALERPERPSQHRRKSSRSLKNNRQHSYGANLSDYFTTDNEKTVLQDVSGTDATLDNSEERSIEFKTEVLKLTHTLKIKNWRKIDLDRGDEVIVKRISGALTNAVYKVHPPEISSEIAARGVDTPHMGAQDSERRGRRRPRDLLLRIYGPQVGHLIDRDTELNILRRLAKQKVGPTLLGTFENGRFEEFYDARTLTREDIQIPETSRQIGRRLRDLHDHIPLLAAERQAGTNVWNNWFKWVNRGTNVMREVQRRSPGEKLLVTTWEQLREVVEKRYLPWLVEKYGGNDQVKESMVFCHNDTQYGNIMAKEADTEPPTPISKSPGLPPLQMTPKKQSLIVIDFEYAGANTRGYEFANHFCEWMSDYTGVLSPVIHTVHADQFPSLEEQRNLIRAYVEHRPLPYAVPTENEQDPMYLRRRQSSIFNLDKLPTKEESKAVDKEVERLLEETRDWRASCNCCWALWGIVQANIPGLIIDEDGKLVEEPDSEEVKREELESGTGVKDGELEEKEDEMEFDYVKYAEQKAMVFYGDMIKLGLVKEEELKQWSGREDVISILKLLP